MTLLIVYAGIALGFSFLCSILEASFLSSRVVNLMERRDGGEKAAGLLLNLKQERLDDALSAILILNTVANTAGSLLAGAQAEKIFDAPWVFIFTVLMILAILLGSEIIPKTLGAVYAQQMVPFTAYAVHALTILFSWAIFVTRLITSVLARRRSKDPISRRELTAMVQAAAREGTLAAGDSRILSSVLSYNEIRLVDVMTPRTVLTMLPVGTTLADFVADETVRVFSRIPVFEEDRDSVRGFVIQRDVLAAAARGKERGTTLAPFVRKVLFLPEAQTVGRALRLLTERREHIALVTDEYGGVSGLVSMEDLLETTLGIEIVDESDRVVDLRVEAVRLREARLEQMRRWRDELTSAAAGAAAAGAAADETVNGNREP